MPTPQLLDVEKWRAETRARVCFAEQGGQSAADNMLTREEITVFSVVIAPVMSRLLVSPRWAVDETDAGFVVSDQNGRAKS